MANKEVKKPYRYFDTPDGEDVFKKLLVVLKPTTAAAIGLATVDVMCYSHPKGYLRTLGRYAYIGLPVIGIAGAFVIATNLSASIRNKDDKINWFIGGVAAGSTLGAWRKNSVIGCSAALGLGFCALLKKYCIENDYTLMPTDVKSMKGGIWAHDWTLTKDRPGKWTTGEQ